MNILHSSEDTEWYTPQSYTDLCREMMGTIDLDPASCEQANTSVKAERYFSLSENSEDGLTIPWNTNTIFLNPPYGKEKGKSNQDNWSKKMIQEYNSGNFREGILLINAVPSNKWFKPLFDYPICFTDHRIHFWNSRGYVDNAPTHSNCFVYFGPRSDRFASCFAKIGTTVEKYAGKEKD